MNVMFGVIFLSNKTTSYFGYNDWRFQVSWQLYLHVRERSNAWKGMVNGFGVQAINDPNHGCFFSKKNTQKTVILFSTNGVLNMLNGCTYCAYGTCTPLKCLRCLCCMFVVDRSDFCLSAGQGSYTPYKWPKIKRYITGFLWPLWQWSYS